MPFGLVNAPSTFSRYMADIFRDLPFVLVYLDDILVMSTTTMEHISHLDTVLSRLKDHQLIAKEKKCQFLQKELKFLGYQIAERCIRPIKDKCEAINALPLCKTIKETQRFLGMINYYRRFIPRCSTVARPLIELIAKKTPWPTEQTKAFNGLKRALVSAPLLVPFSPEREYRLTTDASKLGLGAVLEELINNRVAGVVGYFSKSLQGAQNNYPAGELELLGIIESLRHFKYLLHGKRFKLRTDHISLLALKNRSEPSMRLARWLDHGLFGGHYGDTITYEKVASKFYWPKMLATIRRYVKSCIQCQIMKNSAHKSQGLLMPLPVPEGRWLDIAMDFATDLPRTRSGYDMIMVMVCRFSKRAHFIPCAKTLDAQV
ncbi:hypothetical protein HG536_0F04770 [Torulaspora globosa]|uniref:Reverse transcriptase domain-containing protein n=1 Tax=Torulaspora globosa TaxID=48254 RepID=A0A7G3ZKW4_9SACH|nr:uncharacterized protein HG536_0F04770 [Torulaspora globosa]QLL34150.1 hypothetical protein HG536_0F04770 [Torulaspora globosa]